MEFELASFDLKANGPFIDRYGQARFAQWPGKVTRYADLQEACQAGVAAEIENGALYDRLLATTQRPDIVTVFRNLREASQERHLPAFRRCAERGGRGGGGRQGRRRGNRA